MPRTVKGPDGVLHQFPDDASDAEISRALDASAAQKATPRTWTDTAVNAVPMVTAGIGGLVGGAGGTVAGFGVGGAPGAIGGAALGGAVGESLRQFLNLARGKQAPTTALEAAKDIGVSAITNAAMEGGGQLIGAGMKAAAPAIMAYSAKVPQIITETYDTTSRKIAKTLLDNGINVTEGGLAKLQALLTKSNDEIKAMVNASTGRVAKDDVLHRVDEHAMEVMKSSANPDKALRKAADVERGFLEHPYYKADTISVPDAQRMKVGSYREIGNAYKQPEKQQALKALARGFKEEVETAVPGVAEKNAHVAELMAAKDAVARRVGIESNADPLGILWAAHSPELFVAGVMHKQPIVRSLIARGAWNMAASAAKVSPQVLRSAVFAIAQGQQPEDEK